MTHITEEKTGVSLYGQLRVYDLLAIRAVSLLERAVMLDSQYLFDSLVDAPVKNIKFKLTDGERTLQVTIEIEEVE
jgi:hypothetical protein